MNLTCEIRIGGKLVLRPKMKIQKFHQISTTTKNKPNKYVDNMNEEKEQEYVIKRINKLKRKAVAASLLPATSSSL